MGSEMCIRDRQSGVLAEGDADKLYDNMDQEYLPQLVKGLDAPHAFEVYKKATADERQAIQDEVYDKMDNYLDSDKVSPKVKERVMKEANELFK